MLELDDRHPCHRDRVSLGEGEAEHSMGQDRVVLERLVELAVAKKYEHARCCALAS